MVLNMCLLSIYELATSSLVYQHVPHSNNNLGDSTYHSMVKRGIVMILLVLHPIMSPKYLHYVCCLFVFFIPPCLCWPKTHHFWASTQQYLHVCWSLLFLITRLFPDCFRILVAKSPCLMIEYVTLG